MNNLKNHNYIIEKDVTTAEGIKLKFISLSDDKQTVHYSYIYKKNCSKEKSYTEIVVHDIKVKEKGKIKNPPNGFFDQIGKDIREFHDI